MSHGAKAITKSVTYDCRDNVYNVLAACEIASMFVWKVVINMFTKIKFETKKWIFSWKFTPLKADFLRKPRSVHATWPVKF